MSEAQHLIDWFRSNARDLPWRTAPRDPYRTLVSELMAQQTQIDRVVPRFEAFLRRFPALGELAAATEDEVVEAWSGLGYYRRARLLHRLAREVAAGSGELPTSAAELEQLSGVGPYTAAAVASMVHEEAVPLVDGNVARVGARVLALEGDPRAAAVRAPVLGWVSGLMDEQSPAEINEGLMELGALVCTPANPACVRCPLASGCRARGTGNPEAYPASRKARVTVDLRWGAAVAERDDGLWLLRRVTRGPILRGLWLPPFAELDPRRSTESQILGLLPWAAAGAVRWLAPVKHAITHRRIEVIPMVVRTGQCDGPPEQWRWANPRSPGLPTSSLLGKILKAAGD